MVLEDPLVASSISSVTQHHSPHSVPPVPSPVLLGGSVTPHSGNSSNNSNNFAQRPPQLVSPSRDSASATPLPPPLPSRRSSRPRKRKIMADVATDSAQKDNANSTNGATNHSDEDDNDGTNKKGKTGAKSRRELPAGAVATLKAWLLSPEHFTHPYPTPQDQVILMQKTGIDKKQLKNWFTNARRRIWKPMLKKQLEQGKMAQTGTGGVVALPGSGPGLVTTPTQPGGAGGGVPEYSVPGQPIAAVDHTQVIQQNYQQALQQQQPQQPQANQQQQTGGYESFSSTYVQQQQQQQQQGTQPQQGQPQTNSSQNQPSQQGQPQQQGLHPGMPMGTQINYFSHNQYQPQTQQPQSSVVNDPVNNQNAVPVIPSSSGTGATPPTTVSTSSPANISHMNKTDSHAVLMELFARDQDLVRQATEGAKQRAAAGSTTTTGSGTTEQNGTNSMGKNSSSMPQHPNHQISGIHGSQTQSQHPMSKMSSSGSSTLNKLGNVPSLNSWPHFSSVSSLNNLGMTAVKSITNMSGADLVSQGSLNRKGNLAQVKSIESMARMGRADSYAFLEVFFDNPPSGSNQERRGVKRERDTEDDNVGLSLDGDEASPTVTTTNTMSTAPAPQPPISAPPPPIQPQDSDEKDKDGLKRAYDDALAARGLISVSRSSEKLTDLAIPKEMQRSISQDYLKSMNAGTGGTFTSFSFTANNNTNTNNTSTSNAPPPQQQQPVNKMQKTTPTPPVSSAPTPSSNTPTSTTTNTTTNNSTTTSFNMSSQQYPGQTPQQNFKTTKTVSCLTAPLSDPMSSSKSVEVPATAKCAICGMINVDTQLRPCGHMFHGRCLKPSLQSAQGAPVCPIDGIPMQSAVLAVPTDECVAAPNHSQQPTTTTSYQSNNTTQAPVTKSEV